MKWVQKGRKKIRRGENKNKNKKPFFIDDLGFDEKDLGKKKKGSKEEVC